MDCSNPVAPNSVERLGDAVKRVGALRRQDFDYLNSYLKGAERRHLPTGPLESQQEIRDNIRTFTERPMPPVEEKRELNLPTLEVVHDSIPVCGLLFRGAPLHPPGVAQKKGMVHVTRDFGKIPREPLGLHDVVAVVGGNIGDVRQVYTSGTREGFEKRIAKQMGRKAIPMRTALAQVRGAKKLSQKPLVAHLRKLFPRSANKDWPTMRGESLLDGILDLKLNMRSSAGAPFHKPFSDCIDEVLGGAIPVICRHIKENTLKQLMEEEPELFLVEVKNKTDRYDCDKLTDKTRPYAGMGKHLSILFSIITQGYQATLKTFQQDPTSMSAYGFSSVNGGMEDLYLWAKEKATSRGAAIVYGDDVRIAVRREDGVYIVDPDFSQMDGSIHATDIKDSIALMLQCMQEDGGEEFNENFYKAIGELWAYMTSNPLMIIDGTKIYKKKDPSSGMLSGSPGTTLFNCFKSALTWDCYFEWCSQTGADPLDPNHAFSKMQEWGLELKAGTWNPTKLPEPEVGELITDHKFLGLQTMVMEFGDQPVFVPHLPQTDALTMLTVHKDPLMGGRRPSDTAQMRTLFDRMRGLAITFGHSDPLIISAIHNVVNNIPATAITMTAQNGKKLGDDVNFTCIENLEFPDTCGWPSQEFFLTLYKRRDEGENPTGWTSLFPTLEEFLKGYHNLDREWLEPAVEVKDAFTHVTRTLVQQPIERGEIDTPKVLEVAAALTPVNVPSPAEVVPNPRSKIVETTTGKEASFIPNREMVLLGLLHTGPCTYQYLSTKLGVPIPAVHRLVERLSLFYTNVDAMGIVSIDPLSTPLPAVPPPEAYKDRAAVVSDVQKIQRIQANKIGNRDKQINTVSEVEFFGVELSNIDFSGGKDPTSVIFEDLRQQYSRARWYNPPGSALDAIVTELVVGPIDMETTIARATGRSTLINKNSIIQTIVEASGGLLRKDVLSSTARIPDQPSDKPIPLDQTGTESKAVVDEWSYLPPVNEAPPFHVPRESEVEIPPEANYLYDRYESDWVAMAFKLATLAGPHLLTSVTEILDHTTRRPRLDYGARRRLRSNRRKRQNREEEEPPVPGINNRQSDPNNFFYPQQPHRNNRYAAQTTNSTHPSSSTQPKQQRTSYGHPGQRPQTGHNLSPATPGPSHAWGRPRSHN